MRCFITGAAGFIGSHLAEELLAAGHDVTGLDDLSTGRLDNLRAVASHPRFRLVEGRRVIARTGSASSITQASDLAAYAAGYEDLERRVPDCNLAADLVGFAATRDLDEIIRAVAAVQSSTRQAAA
jgi:NAD(P)-dependent dehydrogenase (short-subunit alcohol dehydrogenase family)